MATQTKPENPWEYPVKTSPTTGYFQNLFFLQSFLDALNPYAFTVDISPTPWFRVVQAKIAIKRMFIMFLPEYRYFDAFYTGPGVPHL